MHILYIYMFFIWKHFLHVCCQKQHFMYVPLFKYIFHVCIIQFLLPIPIVLKQQSRNELKNQQYVFSLFPNSKINGILALKEKSGTSCPINCTFFKKMFAFLSIVYSTYHKILQNKPPVCKRYVSAIVPSKYVQTAKIFFLV